MPPADPTPIRSRLRRPTATALFGSSRRESHDASGFYERFVAPEVSDDATVLAPTEVDVIYQHDARDMGKVESNSVALVVTSPPYFAGKEYEQALGRDGIPGTYFEYLAMLRDVFGECRRVLEPGGRIAVNVANLGRRPYRSLAGDVTQILGDLGLLLRGEVVWWKGRAAGGSCAWGTFQKPANPVLRDVTERIVIASKGRFDRALKPEQRLRLGLPSTATITRDEFLEATTDLWEMPAESATRVGHPAPYPVELPARMIELYTYVGDVVLDPFMGSGSTAVASVRAGRHYVGFDADGAYVERARARIADEVEKLPAAPSTSGGDDDPLTSAIREGRQARDVAAILVGECGFTAIQAGVRVSGLGIEIDLMARDQVGNEWAFDVSGGFTSGHSGLRRVDTMWRAIGKAAVFHHSSGAVPLVLLTTEVPTKGSAGCLALAALRGPGLAIYDVIRLLDDTDHDRLRRLAQTGPTGTNR